MKSKKILITGGAGFIGSHLVDRLIKDGHNVAVVDDLSTGKKENINKQAKFYNIDICDLEISQIFENEKPDIVFHLAAQINVRKSIENPLLDNRINVLGTINILENCRKHNVEKIIFISTGGAIYGEAEIIPTPENYPENPLSPYGINKLAAEKYLNYYYKVFGIPFTALRLANVYGPGQNSEGEAGVIAIFSSQMLFQKQPLINGNGRQTRDFVFVDDVVDSCILTMDKNKTGIFNIGTSKETDINKIFDKIKSIIDSKTEKEYGSEIKEEQKRSCLDISKAKIELDWHPRISLDEGLEKTVKYFKEKNYENHSNNSSL